MEKILISACLLGQNVRYDGENAFINHPMLSKWQTEKRLYPLCPEVDGGLSIPRAPCEKDPKSTRIFNQHGHDHTDAFDKGARSALKLAQQETISIALLKERSPSCGSHEIYDGTFSGRRIKGMGLTAELLSQNGITVFSEDQINALIAHIEQKEGVS